MCGYTFPSAPDPVTNININLNNTLTNFNSTSRVLTTPITITWQPPLELYGTFEEYSVLVQIQGGVEVVYQNSSVVESIFAVVMLFPNEVYMVTVTVTTGGGMSDNSATFTSPEAGMVR